MRLGSILTLIASTRATTSQVAYLVDETNCGDILTTRRLEAAICPKKTEPLLSSFGALGLTEYLLALKARIIECANGRTVTALIDNVDRVLERYTESWAEQYPSLSGFFAWFNRDRIFRGWRLAKPPAAGQSLAKAILGGLCDTVAHNATVRAQLEMKSASTLSFIALQTFDIGAACPSDPQRFTECKASRLETARKLVDQAVAAYTRYAKDIMISAETQTTTTTTQAPPKPFPRPLVMALSRVTAAESNGVAAAGIVAKLKREVLSEQSFTGQVQAFLKLLLTPSTYFPSRLSSASRVLPYYPSLNSCGDPIQLIGNSLLLLELSGLPAVYDYLRAADMICPGDNMTFYRLRAKEMLSIISASIEERLADLDRQADSEGIQDWLDWVGLSTLPTKNKTPKALMASIMTSGAGLMFPVGQVPAVDSKEQRIAKLENAVLPGLKLKKRSALWVSKGDSLIPKLVNVATSDSCAHFTAETVREGVLDAAFNGGIPAAADYLTATRDYLQECSHYDVLSPILDPSIRLIHTDRTALRTIVNKYIKTHGPLTLNKLGFTDQDSAAITSHAKTAQGVSAWFKAHSEGVCDEIRAATKFSSAAIESAKWARKASLKALQAGNTAIANRAAVDEALDLVSSAIAAVQAARIELAMAIQQSKEWTTAQHKSPLFIAILAAFDNVKAQIKLAKSEALQARADAKMASLDIVTAHPPKISPASRVDWVMYIIVSASVLALLGSLVILMRS